MDIDWLDKWEQWLQKRIEAQAVDDDIICGNKDKDYVAYASNALHELIDDFDKVNFDYELTACYQEDDCSLFNMEKRLILIWAKHKLKNLPY